MTHAQTVCTRPFFFLPHAKRARLPTREKEGLGTRLLEETKPFARASKAVYQPGAGPVDEKSNSSLSEMAIQPLRASSKNNWHHNSTACTCNMVFKNFK